MGEAAQWLSANVWAVVFVVIIVVALLVVWGLQCYDEEACPECGRYDWRDVLASAETPYPRRVCGCCGLTQRWTVEVVPGQDCLASQWVTEPQRYRRVRA